MKNKTFLILLAVICLVTIFPFLGESLFQSKGEPREAIVAVSMLDSGNWILPVNNGGDIAYKPPFFHWCIALASLVPGHVTEYTARFPSAVALVVMTLFTYLFFAKRRGAEVAFVTSLVTLTAFEVHRAGWACRVDMVLTVFIVLALFQLYRWYERDEHGFPIWATLWMGCATLTKGPIGIILPCLVMGVFLLVKGRGFWITVGRMLLVAIVSCILPAIWYVAAYRQGGDNFLSLVMEENFGRFMGKMSYESHVHGPQYNFTTVLAGYVPYTLLMLLCIPFAIKGLHAWKKPQNWWRSFCTYIKGMDDARLFSLLSFALIFVFYCIPKSKRSTYLLPIYPFIAFFLAEFLLYLRTAKPSLLRVYGSILSVVTFLPVAAFFLLKSGVASSLLPQDKTKGAGQIIGIIESTPIDWIHWIYISLPILAVIVFVRRLGDDRRGVRSVLYPLFGIIFTLYVSLDSVFLPEVLNAKSDKPIAEAVGMRAGNAPLYSYITADMMRYFTVNFYLHNRIQRFEVEHPQEGYLLVGPQDEESFRSSYPGYQLQEVYRSEKKSCDTKAIIVMYKFKKVS